MRRPLRLLALVGGLLSGAVPPAAAEPWRDQVAAVHAAIAPYRDVQRARADGWRQVTAHVPLMGEHWSLGRAGPDYVSGGTLDLTRPSNLIYARIGGRRELVAVAYVVRIGPDDPLPEGFAGSSDRWHVHNIDQILAAVGQDRPLIARLGRSWIDRRFASDGKRRLAMVHVWLDGRNPHGTFENLDPTLPYRRLGLPASAWNGAPLDAARGVALALPDGCAEALDGKLRLAGVAPARKRALSRLCEGYAVQLRPLIGGSPPEALNRSAAAAWRAFQGQMAETLDPAELARMDAIVEGQADHAMGR